MLGSAQGMSLPPRTSDDESREHHRLNSLDVCSRHKLVSGQLPPLGHGLDRILSPW